MTVMSQTKLVALIVRGPHYQLNHSSTLGRSWAGEWDFLPALPALILAKPGLADDWCRRDPYEWLQVGPAMKGRGNCQSETSVTAANPPNPSGRRRVWHPGLRHIELHVRLANLSSVGGGSEWHGYATHRNCCGSRRKARFLENPVDRPIPHPGARVLVRACIAFRHADFGRIDARGSIDVPCVRGHRARHRGDRCHGKNFDG